MSRKQENLQIHAGLKKAGPVHHGQGPVSFPHKAPA